MPSLLSRINTAFTAVRGNAVAVRGQREVEERFSADQYAQMLGQSGFIYNGVQYMTGGGAYSQMRFQDAVAEISNTLPAYAAAVRAAPPAFAAELVRSLILSQARFTFRGRQSSSKPRRTFGTRALGLLEEPAPGLTTGELIATMEWHAGLAGNAYVYRQTGKAAGGRPRLRVLRPDWTAILWGSQAEPDDAPYALDNELLGYVYWNGGYGRNRPWSILPSECAHWAPIADPENAGLGQSWVTPALRDMQGDKAATDHKLKFFSNGAIPGLVIKGITGANGQPLGRDQFNELVDMMELRHSGAGNAYKTLYLTGGADATVIGANLKEIDFTAVQGRSETRISFLSRVPASLLGISEGLAGSSLNAGNFGMARRIFADSWVYPTLQNLAGALSTIVDVPSDAELWFDTSDMPILREDSKDQAEILQTQASAIASLINSGYTPESVVIAIQTGDLSQLKHTGLYSVQLQPPQSGQTPGAVPPGGPVAPDAGGTAADPGTATDASAEAAAADAEPAGPAPTKADWDAALADAKAAVGRSKQHRPPPAEPVRPADGLTGTQWRDAVRAVAGLTTAAAEPDSGDDVVAAAKRALRESDQARTADVPIGKIDAVWEDSHGLHVRGRLLTKPDTPVVESPTSAAGEPPAAPPADDRDSQAVAEAIRSMHAAALRAVTPAVLQLGEPAPGPADAPPAEHGQIPDLPDAVAAARAALHNPAVTAAAELAARDLTHRAAELLGTPQAPDNAAPSAGPDDEDDDGDWDDDSLALLTALDEMSPQDGHRSDMLNALLALRAKFNPADHPRNPKGAAGGGRFRSLVDRVKDAVEAHKAGGSGDPLEGFNRPQLRKVAKARGIELKRGESDESIKAKLLDHIGGKSKGKPGGEDDGDAKLKKTPAKHAPAKHEPAQPADKPTSHEKARKSKKGLGDLLGRQVDPDTEREIRDLLDGTYAGLEVRVADVKARPGVIIMRADIHDSSGKKVGQTARQFWRGDPSDPDVLWAYHDVLELDKEVQGQGFAQAWNGHLGELYAQSGTSYIKTEANIDVGGYTWARQGFDFEDDDARADWIGQARTKVAALRKGNGKNTLPGLTRAQVDEQISAMEDLLDRMDSGEAVSTYEISQLGRQPGMGRDDPWIGKATMLGSDWRAIKWLTPSPQPTK